ncbi:hypothetical protein PCANC_06581 [Puccinia coronata f. sp. avenae]|uniref:Uncharacterized protein n=1 Tax=Puccinia coronata f. sp. avenae TaxID=200324 RepID=A0A2N5VA50_9BASI|nr:hypothetical protein PCASD_09506 [Puccinia coronata f. sp. avenae]PLW46888.1 hypothetical protein PCANC_06581 [Puccinia coronata f. sp. avenae]
MPSTIFPSDEHTTRRNHQAPHNHKQSTQKCENGVTYFYSQPELPLMTLRPQLHLPVVPSHHDIIIRHSIYSADLTTPKLLK